MPPMDPLHDPTTVVGVKYRLFGLIGRIQEGTNLGPFGCLISLLVGVILAVGLLLVILNSETGGDSPATPDAVAEVSDWAGSFGGWAVGQSQNFTYSVITTTTTTTTVPAPLTPIASSGSWQFTQFGGQMDCDGLVITIAPSGPISGEIAVLEDGRILSSGIGDDLAEVLAELDEDAPDANTYVGAIVPQDGAEGVELEFTITFVDDEHATTHIGGAIVSDGVRCSVDRRGEATLTG